MKSRIDQIEEKIDKILHVLNGNGQEGLVSRVYKHEDYIKQGRWWRGTIVGLTVTIAMTGVGAVYKYGELNRQVEQNTKRIEEIKN